MKAPHCDKTAAVSRRGFLASGAAALAPGAKRPNFLLVITDQQRVDTIAAGGCAYLKTPNMDRLVRQGVCFTESYSTNPVCSPARSSLLSGRTTCETGVIGNVVPIRSDIPNLGRWMRNAGYETVYSGKWHLPGCMANANAVDGFTVLPAGICGPGTFGDQAVSSACEGFLQNRKGSDPFLLVASFLQPHDICNWIFRHANAPDVLPFPEAAGALPPLPKNFNYDPAEPRDLNRWRAIGEIWSERQWRYYFWSYYRMVEEVDAEIGRVLDALEQGGYADNTVVIFTSDHGEGLGQHRTLMKNFLYEEAVKVPMVVSWPGHTARNFRDTEHLVSGLDIMPTICDLAGARPPAHTRGLSLRPLLERKRNEWREFVVTEAHGDRSRMIRTPDYKYMVYSNDPVQQLFDIKNDPGETRNLWKDSKHASVIRDLRKLLEGWESRLDRAPKALPAFRA